MAGWTCKDKNRIVWDGEIEAREIIGTLGGTFAGFKISNDGTKTTLLGKAGDYIRIGDATTASGPLNDNNDLLVTGILETSESIYMNNITGGVIQLYFTEAATNTLGFRADHSTDQALIRLGSGIGRQLCLVETTTGTQDFDHATQTNPTLFIHSSTAPNTNNTQWLSLTHDTTDALIKAGTGDVKIDDDLNVTGTFKQDGTAGIDATVSYTDTVLGAKVLTFKKGILTAQT